MAMSPRTWVITGFALALGSVATWTLISPFPASLPLLNEPLASLTAKFGPPSATVPAGAVPWRSPRSLTWEKSRGIGVWIFAGRLGQAAAHGYDSSRFRVSDVASPWNKPTASW